MTLSGAKDSQPSGDSYDVVIVGGGASGLAAAVFTARYGFSTLVFDRGQSAIRRSYTIENYLGFLGIDPATFLELGRAHAKFEGSEIVDDLVVECERAGSGFRIQTQDGASVTSKYVVAASAYNADYLTSLDGGSFHSDGDHPVDCDEATGRTTIDGLYVAGWLSGGPHQVLISAGHGARVAKALIHDHRQSEDGYWDDVADYWDWRVEDGTYGDEQWHTHVDEWFDETIPADHEYDDAHVSRVREEIKQERLASQQSQRDHQHRIERGRVLVQRYLDGMCECAGDTTE